MIELSPGKSVYTYESHLTKANAKKTATTTACSYWAVFTLRMSWWGEALVAKMANRLSTISDSGVKISLGNKITCTEVKLRKRNVHIVS